MKKIYEALETIEGGADLVAELKKFVTDHNETEAKLRHAEKQVEQFAGIDMAEAKALKEFAEKHGGVKGISDIAKKAGETEAKVLELQGKYDNDLKLFKSEAEKAQSDAKRYAMELKLQPYFVENFHNGDRLMKNALADGLIVEGESGLLFKSGDKTVPLDKGGFDSLKEHDSLKWALKLPAGGDTSGGANGGNTGNTGKPANPFDI
jgi:hypothetical protein